MDNAIYNSGDLLNHRHNSPVACRSMQWGEGHRQNSAVARSGRFSLASGRQVRQDRCCSDIDRFSEPLPPSVGALVFLGFLSPGSTSKKITRYRAAKTAGTQVFQDEQN